MVLPSRQPPTSGAVDLSSVVLRDGTQALTGNLSMGGNKLTSLGNPSAPGDAANKSYVDVADLAVLASLNSTVLYRNGTSTLTDNWYVGGFQLKNLADPTDPQDAATRAWVLANSAGLPAGGSNGAILGYAGGVGAWVTPGTAGQPLVSNGTSIAAFSATVAALTQRVIDSATNAVSTAATVTHQLSAGGAAAGIGTRLVFRTERTAGVVADSAYIDAVLTVASATPTSELRVGVQSAGAIVTPLAVRSTGLVLRTNFPLLYDAGVELDVFRFAGATMTFGTTNNAYSNGTTIQTPTSGNLLLNRGSTTYLHIQGGGGFFLGSLSDFVRINASYVYINAPVQVRDVSNNTVSTVTTFGHALSGGVAAAGIGVRLALAVQNNAGSQVEAAYVAAVLTTASSASEVSALGFFTRTGGALTERLRIHGAGGVTVGTTASLTSGLGLASGLGLWGRNAADSAWINAIGITGGEVQIGDSNNIGVQIITGGLALLRVQTAGVIGLTYRGYPNASSGIQQHLKLSAPIEQTGTAGWTLLDLSPTLTTQGSGTKRAISYSVSSVERFGINELGRIVNGNATNEATTATAGTNGAPPAQVAGYLIIQDSAGNARKVPYYAN